MLDRNHTHVRQTRNPQVRSEQRWNPRPHRQEEQRDLIKELGYLQITPGGFVY